VERKLAKIKEFTERWVSTRGGGGAGRELAGGAGGRGRRRVCLEHPAKFDVSRAAGRALWAAQGRADAASSRSGAFSRTRGFSCFFRLTRLGKVEGPVMISILDGSRNNPK
jgi:hypothetical protein